MKIKLSENEIRLCEFIAKQRRESNRAANVHDSIKERGSDPWHLECEGVMSELAFSLAMDKYPTEIFLTDIRSAANGEDRGDVTINGICIDVKSTKYRSGQLLCVKRNPSIDLIVLLIGEKGSYELSGGMWAKDIYQEHRYGTTNKIPYPCYKASQEELLTTEQVLDIISHTSSSKANPESAPAFDWSLP